MPLLLIPLLVLGLALLWAVLLPLSLWQRYRLGRMRRRAWPWIVRANAWLLLASTFAFLAGAWFAGRWVPDAGLHALGGLAAGMVLGMAGVWLARWEPGTPLYYTPNAWLVLLLTLLVAGRIALGAWQVLWHWHAAPGLPPSLAGHASLFAAGGLLLGYAVWFAWAIRRRLPVRAAGA